MRIHTDKPEAVASAIMEAVRALPGVYVTQLSAHRSRKRNAAFELRLSGNGRRGGQWGNTDDKSATWDEWGVVFGALFKADEYADATYYQGAEHYNWMTGNRFASATLPEDTHPQHRWSHAGTVATGTYHVSKCTKCSALTRRMAYGHTFAEIA